MMKLLIIAFSACLFQAVVSGRMMTGGWSDVEDTNSEDFQEIVRFATNKIAVSLGSSNRKQAIEVLSARKQIVAGVSYKIVMKIGETDCKINEVDENCNLKSDGEIHKCTAKVWQRKWLNATELTDFSCDKEEKTT